MRLAVQTGHGAARLISLQHQPDTGVIAMKKSRGGRMTAAKRRASKTRGGRGLVKNRTAGRRIMKS
jgi:hypothetical protein